MVNLAGSRCFARFRKNILILTKPRANAQRVVKSVVIPTGEVVPEVRDPTDLMIVRLGTDLSGMLQAQTMLLQHTAAFTEMSPTAFISAMASSGGSETDCRDFATKTTTDISTTVTSTQKMLADVDIGSSCAAMGQDAVSTATAAVTAAKAKLETAKTDKATKQSAKVATCSAMFELRSGTAQPRRVQERPAEEGMSRHLRHGWLHHSRCCMYFCHHYLHSSRPSRCHCHHQGH